MELQSREKQKKLDCVANKLRGGKSTAERVF